MIPAGGPADTASATAGPPLSHKVGSLPAAGSGETVLQFLFRRLGDLLGPALHEFEIVLGGMDVILQQPELLCGPLDPGKPLLLLPFQLTMHSRTSPGVSISCGSRW